MGSDNQWTALGPAIVGFQTDGTNIDRGADIAGKLVGIKGACMGDVGDGVQGFGAGNFSGVAGFGGTDNGTGVFGIGGVPPDRFGGGGAGVRGVGAGAPNTSPSGPVGVFGQGGTNTPGVVGQGGDGTADGVQGYATGPFSGVAGFGGATDGSGVFGSGGGRVGPGVRGIGAGGSNTAPAGPVGVYGQGGGPTGTGVVGIGAGGSNTESPTSDGVFGEAGKGGGSAGVRGVSNQFNGTGIWGIAESGPQAVAVAGSSATGFAGFFAGNFVVAVGAKSVAMPHADGSHRLLYCMESPENWFEDFGTGHLVNGIAKVSIDPGFAAVIHPQGYHVFLAEHDDHHGLYVTQRTSSGFEVRAKSSAASGTFSYRVVAKRKGFEQRRLEEVKLPHRGS
ncbi:MAG: hypothetical protein WBY94_25430 [Polyangiaceae bacterium]